MKKTDKKTKKVVYTCDHCGKAAEGEKLPEGWLDARSYHFCCQDCLVKWSDTSG